MGTFCDQLPVPHSSLTWKTFFFTFFFKVIEQIQRVQIECPMSKLAGPRMKTDSQGWVLDHQVGSVLHGSSTSSVAHGNMVGPVCVPKEMAHRSLQ